MAAVLGSGDGPGVRVGRPLACDHQLQPPTLLFLAALCSGLVRKGACPHDVHWRHEAASAFWHARCSCSWVTFSVGVR